MWVVLVSQAHHSNRFFFIQCPSIPSKTLHCDLRNYLSTIVGGMRLGCLLQNFHPSACYVDSSSWLRNTLWLVSKFILFCFEGERVEFSPALYYSQCFPIQKLKDVEHRTERTVIQEAQTGREPIFNIKADKNKIICTQNKAPSDAHHPFPIEMTVTASLPY